MKIKGDDGVGIKSIKEYYLASALNSGVTTENEGWTTTIQTTDEEKQYLWNYEEITYSNGNVQKSEPLIIGNYSKQGDNAQFYRLVANTEKAIVSANGTLGVNLQYQIAKINGSQLSYETANKSAYWVRFRRDDNNAVTELSTGTTTPNVSKSEFITNYHKQASKPSTLIVELMFGSSDVKDKRVVPIIFDAAATLTVGETIQASVQDNKQKIDTVENNLSTYEQTSTEIIQTVQKDITNLKIGDTKNLFDETSYNGGELDTNNKWEFDVDGKNETYNEYMEKYLTPIYQSQFDWEMYETGETYLYTPRLSLVAGDYTLRMWADILSDGIFRIDVCEYADYDDIDDVRPRDFTTIYEDVGINQNNLLHIAIAYKAFYRLRFVLDNSEGYDSANLVGGDIQLYRGNITDVNEFVNIPSQTIKMYSSIKQSASEIELKVQETGINIENHKITLNADNTNVTGNLTVKSLKTQPTANAYIVCQGSNFDIYGTNATPSISIGVDENGNAYFKFFNERGQEMYNLGANGLKQLIDSTIAASWSGRYFLNIQSTSLNQINTVVRNSLAANNGFTYNASYTVLQDGTRQYGSYAQYNGKIYKTGLDSNLNNNSYLSNTSNMLADGYYLMPSAMSNPQSIYDYNWIIDGDRTPQNYSICKMTIWKCENHVMNVQDNYIYFYLPNDDIERDVIACDENGNKINSTDYPYIWSYGMSI